MKHFVILGAGISGLAMGHYLATRGQKVTILEKGNKIGGHDSSFHHNGFTLDYGPHKLYSQLDGIIPFIKETLGEDTLEVKKLNSLYLLGKYFSFPLNLGNIFRNISPKTIGGGLSVGFSALPTFFSGKKEPENFEEYFIRGFGKEGYHLIFEGYAKKVWGHPRELSPELARKRVPVQSIPHLISQHFSHHEKKKVSAEFFYYPKHGLIELSEKLAQSITAHGGEILLEHPAEKIQRRGNEIVSVVAKGKHFMADEFVSTLHLIDLVSFITPALDAKLVEASQNLKHSSLRLCYVFLNKPRAMKDAWIFFPSADIIFNRISEQKAFSPFTCPEDKTVLMAEVTVPPGSEIEHWTKEQVFERVKNDLVKVGLIKEHEIFDHLVLGEKRIYPVYDLAYSKNLGMVTNSINQISNLVTIGRPGLFNYNNMDHCIDMAFCVGEALLKGEVKGKWPELAARFEEYRIVD